MFASPLTADQLARVYACWDSVNAARAANHDDMVAVALAHLSELAGAQNAWWLGAVRVSDAPADDPLNGWRPRRVRYLHSSPVDTAFAAQATRQCDGPAVDESVVAHTRGTGVFRAYLLREIVSPAWYDSAFYDLAYRARDVHDCLFVITPVNADAESYFGFQRKGGHPAYETADRDLLAHAMRGLQWLHREALLTEGLAVASKPLTPAERRVLAGLLTPRSEKEIAAWLGLSPRTTHHHVTEILRKFGVNSRTALMALWLGRNPAAG